MVWCIGVLLLAGRSWAGFTSVETLDSTSVEKVLQDGTIYRVRESVTLVAPTNRSALSVAPGATAVIYIEPEVTLSVTGGAAVTNSPAGAGINVPLGSTLIVCGSGTLNAVGGSSAGGEDGYDGVDAAFNFHAEFATVGTGGAGGYGGGGPGAGIGGSGGWGGPGGSANPPLHWGADHRIFSKDGNQGRMGGDASHGEPGGVVYLLGAVKVNVTGGDPGDVGVTGEKGESVNDSGSGWTYYYFAAGGGGGGGGDKGTQAYTIGGGGGGGGGGGSGGDGPTTVKSGSWLVTLAGRDGGTGGQFGEPTEGPWGQTHDDAYVFARPGGNGGRTGIVGNPNALYLAPEVSLNQLGGRSYPYEPITVDTHSALTYTVTFDTRGGGDLAAMESQLGMPLPGIATVPVREGLVFNGFWTEPYGRGVRCYDSAGEPVVLHTEPGDIALYADWVIEDSFVVTTEEDLSPEESAARGLVSLRSAIAEINGKFQTGARNRYTITFASSVSNVVLEHPLAVVGSSDADSLQIVIDGAAGRDASDDPVIIGLQDETAGFSLKDASLTVRNLALDGAGAQPSSSTSPNVFRLDGAVVFTVENCAFNDFDRQILIFVPAASTGTRRSVRILDSSFQNWKGKSGQMLLSANCPSALAADAVFANCTFWQCAGFGDYAMIVGAGEKAAIVNCTVCNSQAGKDTVLIQYGARMVECLLDDAVQVSGSPAALLRDVYCREVRTASGSEPDSDNVIEWDKTELFFGDGKVVRVAGVDHHVIEPSQGLFGSFVWHDAGWDNIAVSSDRAGADRVPVLGDAAKADILRLSDEIGKSLPSDIDWAPPPGALVRATRPFSLVVENTGDPELPADSPYVTTSLRVAIYALVKYPWLVNPYTLDRTITFSPEICSVIVDRPLPVIGTLDADFPEVVIDGSAGRNADDPGVTVKLGIDERVTLSAQDASLVLRDIRFLEPFGSSSPQTDSDALSLRGESALTVENCSFSGYNRTILSLRADDDSDGRRSARFLGCWFGGSGLQGESESFVTDCPADGADDFVMANCTFDGSILGSIPLVAGSGAKSLLVNCSFNVSHGNTLVTLKDGARMAECVVNGYVQTENAPWLRDVYCQAVNVSGGGCESNNVVEADACELPASVFFDSGTRLESHVRGVVHVTSGVTRGVFGSFVWHDAGWDNVAISSDRDGSDRSPLLGDATKTDILRVTDEIGGIHPADAAWAPPAGAVVRATSSVSLVIESDVKISDLPLMVSDEKLEDAILAAVSYPWLVNPNTLDRTITFDKGVAGVKLEHSVVIRKDATVSSDPFVIDGSAGRSDSPARIDVNGTGCFSLSDGAVTFRNVEFEHSTYMIDPPSSVPVFSFFTSGQGVLTLENCSFMNVGRSVFTYASSARPGPKCSARILGCYFDGCYDSSGGAVLRATCSAAGTFDFVVADCSFEDCQFYAFGNDLGVINCSGAKAVVVNCTVFEQNAPNSVRLADGARMVECLIDDIVQTDGTPYLRDVYCLRVNASAPKYSSDSYNVVEAVDYDLRSSAFFGGEHVHRLVRGVYHSCSLPAQAVTGSFVWHDAGWDNIAVSFDRAGSDRVSLLGDATKADVLRVTDEVGNVHPVDAAWAPPAGAIMREIPPPSLVVGSEEEPTTVATSPYVLPMSFRSACSALADFPWLLNSDTHDRTITFAPNVQTIMLKDKIAVSGQDLSVAVDGNVGRGNLPAVRVTNGGVSKQCAFMVEDGAQLELDNLVFENFGSSSGDNGAVVQNTADSARIRIVNCSFRNVNLQANGAVLKMTGNSAKLFVDGCSFYDISSSASDTRVIDFEPDYPGQAARAVVSRCTFANNKGTAFYCLNNDASKNSVISCSTFYKNADYGVFSHLTDIYSSLMLGNGKADLAVTDDGKNTVSDTWAYKLPSGTTKRIGVTRGGIGARCNKDPSTYLYLKCETNVVHGVEHVYYRPRMQSIPELGKSSPKAAGGFVAHSDDWNSVVSESSWSSIIPSLTPVSLDLVEESINPERLPCAGAVFYGEEEIVEPVVTTTDPASSTDYKMSVEEAFALARSDPDNNTVTFSDELYDTNGVAIVGFDNLMDVSNASVIVKAPAGKTTVLAYVPKLRTDGHGADEIARTHAFYIREGASLTLEGLVISNAVGNIEGIAQRHFDRATSGGAILCYGRLDASDCVFTCCEAGPQRYLAEHGVPTGVGGAVCTVGPESLAHLDDCTFEYCHAACGGAVASVDGGKMYVANGVFRRNVAWTTLLQQGFGGAAYREGNDSVLDLGAGPVFEENETRSGTNVWADVVEKLVDENGRTVISVPVTPEIGEPPLMLSVSAPQTLHAATPSSAASFAARLTVAGREWYSAQADGTTVGFVLNAKATPSIEAAAAEGVFSATVGNVKPGLDYALGWSDTPDGDFAEHLRASNWITAGDDGSLPELFAPKGGDGSRFYRVLVK